MKAFFMSILVLSIVFPLAALSFDEQLIEEKEIFITLKNHDKELIDMLKIDEDENINEDKLEQL